MHKVIFKPILLRLSAIVAVLALLLGNFNVAGAQGTSQTFPETGHTVSGRFLEYWTQNGGLAQQGYPISEPMQEKSDLNGQTYTVQYFERAVFEMHPENQAPYDVLLSQLGKFQYRAKYGTAGAPSQTVSTTNPRVFPETGFTVGGAFRDYWEQHGGLAQQGFPLSNEFQEKSDLDGKTYTVQYFERAVFEMHPENQAPYNVLLSQLGKFQYRAKYQGGTTSSPTPVAGAPSATPVAGQPSATPAPAQPSATPAPAQPSATPVAAADPCANVPAPVSATITPSCGPAGTTFTASFSGFTPNEALSFWFTDPAGRVVGTANPIKGSHPGHIDDFVFDTDSSFDVGLWAITFQGASSGHQAIAYFKIVAAGQSGGGGSTADCSNIPASVNQVVTPNCGPKGTRFAFSGSGFKPGEQVGIYATQPDQAVFGAPFQATADASGVVSGISLTTDSSFPAGIWALSMEGTTTHAKSIGYFKVTN